MKSASFVLRIFPPHRTAPAAAACAAIVAMCASAPSRGDDVIPLTVRYPGEGAHIAAVPESFLFGATAPGAVVTVNGQTAMVAPDGAWIAYVPFSSGRFVLQVKASLGNAVAEVDRTVLVDDGSVPAYPSETTIVQPGEALTLAVTAADGASVVASGPGFPNAALAPAPKLGTGAFSGAAVVQEPASPAPIVYHVTYADGRKADLTSVGTLGVASQRVLFAGDVVAETPDRETGTRPYGMLAPTPDADTDFTLPVGTQVEITGRSGDQFRVALAGAPPQWIDRREVTPDLHADVPLQARLESTERTESATRTTFVAHLSGSRMPFRVDEAPAGDVARGTITIFGVGSVPFFLHQHAFWGYRARWSGSDLIVAFRKPPLFARPPHAALLGLRVVVDPGHAPDSGAVGPLGTVERDINLDISLRLAAKLRARGADVILTRTDSQSVPLYDRPALAERVNADVLISVHNNAWADGADPARQHGYSVYYFQPHSYALAQEIHRAYGERTDLPDAGLHKGDLALVRTSELPSVLTESAFITWPWEEMKLRDATFRDRLAQSMGDGLETWAEKMRALETHS